MTPYQRALHDPAFLGRFTRAYQGSHDPLDALWWQERPGDTAPSGAPAPGAALAALRRAVYAPGAGQTVRERFRLLSDQVERERVAVHGALAAAERTEAGSPADPEEAAPTDDAVDAAGPAAPARPARLSLLLAVAGTAAVAFVAGLLAAPALGGKEVARSAPPPAPLETAPFISGAAGSGSAMGIFGEPQRDVDRPLAGVGAHLLEQSFRRLESVPTRRVTVFAAQDSRGDVCLVAVSVDARLAASCSSVAAFRAAPLQLAFRADAYTDDGRRVENQVELTVTWGFLNQFSLDEAPVTGK